MAGAAKPLRHKFSGIVTQGGLTIALRPIKQNPQIAGVIIEGFSYADTLLSEIPTVPASPMENADMSILDGVGPRVPDDPSLIYDPSTNPKFNSPGVPNSVGQQSVGAPVRFRGESMGDTRSSTGAGLFAEDVSGEVQRGAREIQRGAGSGLFAANNFGPKHENSAIHPPVQEYPAHGQRSEQPQALDQSLFRSQQQGRYYPGVQSMQNPDYAELQQEQIRTQHPSSYQASPPMQMQPPVSYPASQEAHDATFHTSGVVAGGYNAPRGLSPPTYRRRLFSEMGNAPRQSDMSARPENLQSQAASELQFGRDAHQNFGHEYVGNPVFAGHTGRPGIDGRQVPPQVPVGRTFPPQFYHTPPIQENQATMPQTLAPAFPATQLPLSTGMLGGVDRARVSERQHSEFEREPSAFNQNVNAAQAPFSSHPIAGAGSTHYATEQHAAAVGLSDPIRTFGGEAPGFSEQQPSNVYQPTTWPESRTEHDAHLESMRSNEIPGRASRSDLAYGRQRSNYQQGSILNPNLAKAIEEALGEQEAAQAPPAMAPGLHVGNGKLEGLCIDNSTHCSCGSIYKEQSAAMGATEDCLYVMNGSTDPMSCAKRACANRLVCACAAGADMLCERVEAKDVLVRASPHHYGGEEDRTGIVQCKRETMESGIIVLQPVM